MDTRWGSGGKTHNPYDQDTYFQSISLWRKRWIIAPIVSLLTWITLSYGSYHHVLQPHHGFICILLSLTLGYWIFALCYLWVWIIFLRPRLKKPSSHAFGAHRILIARKKGTHCINPFRTGIRIVCIFLHYIYRSTNYCYRSHR